MKSIVNRRASYDYDLQDKFTAGVILHGHEAKSLRLGDGNLRGSYINVIGGELWLVGAHIHPYRSASGLENYDPYRSRKLLVKKSELQKLIAAKQNGLTIVPTRFITSSRFIKLEFAIGRGRKKHDKRQKKLRQVHKREAKSGA